MEDGWRIVGGWGTVRGWAVGGKPESGDGDASASGRDVDSLKASLRENIMQKHEFKARATAAEARVAALEAALAAAGIEAP